MSKQQINDERLNSHNQLIYLTLITKLAKSNWKRSQILAELLPRWGERGISLSLPESPREERERLSRTNVAIPPVRASLHLPAYNSDNHNCSREIGKQGSKPKQGSKQSSKQGSTPLPYHSLPKQLPVPRHNPHSTRNSPRVAGEWNA